MLLFNDPALCSLQLVGLLTQDYPGILTSFAWAHYSSGTILFKNRLLVVEFGTVGVFSFVKLDKTLLGSLGTLILFNYS